MKTRFIESVIKAARTEKVVLPWQRDDAPKTASQSGPKKAVAG